METLHTSVYLHWSLHYVQNAARLLTGSWSVSTIPLHSPSSLSIFRVHLEFRLYYMFLKHFLEWLSLIYLTI